MTGAQQTGLNGRRWGMQLLLPEPGPMPDTHITDGVTSSGSKSTCRSGPGPKPLNSGAQGNQVLTFWQLSVVTYKIKGA